MGCKSNRIRGCPKWGIYGELATIDLPAAAREVVKELFKLVDRDDSRKISAPDFFLYVDQ